MDCTKNEQAFIAEIIELGIVHSGERRIGLSLVHPVFL